ncbi:PilT/PilU family type 4a pilus ATPase [Myxococcota bacterium]|nr:PilT/PilU family type 4a pilus ATPase [Myxococcota bacterium]MBU1433048.1 PilT/PilU family type 4a pilus ATPase [Myxococcota bacterium]MBU1899917.1 PilT/PilU family type 4a pilus ATPase [Myxococcota bacterium]
MATLHDLLKELVDSDADSLQFRAGQPPLLFINREARPIGMIPLEHKAIEGFLTQLLDNPARATLMGLGQADGHYTNALGRFDFRVRDSQDGYGIAFRYTPPAAEATKEATEPEVLIAWPKDSIHALLSRVYEERAADLVVSNGLEARVRTAAGFVAVRDAIFSDQAIREALKAQLTPEREARLSETGSLDLALELRVDGRQQRFRVNLFRQRGGLAAAFRPIWDQIPGLSTLNIPEALLSYADIPYGLVLVTGPTGSGKSTTISALVEHINATRARHIITLEDPIEYVFSQKRSMIHQREVGVHVDAFSSGLRAALREAPDVIFLGEMRDLQTISAALTAAETGHLVLSTLHSGSAAQAIDRIIDIFPEHQQMQVRIQLSDVLRGIITQRLLPTTKKRRIPAFELVKTNYALANLIRERRTHQFSTVIQTHQKEGMVPFDLSLARLVNEGLVEREEALRCARDQKYLLGLIQPQLDQSSEST